MSETIIPRQASIPQSSGEAGWLNRVARRIVLDQLAKLPEGKISLSDPLGETTVGGSGGLRASVTVGDTLFYRDVLLGGSLGAAESYINGRWHSDDLTALIRVFARNLETADALERGWARPAAVAARLWHQLRANTRSGSKRNIHAHYDLGNEFFELLLDPSMNYSSAIFDSPDATLEAAQRNKMDRICRKLQLGPRDHLLEIGTGWGALAMYAAKEFGCRVTTTTISREQHRLASERVQAAGLGDRITLLLEDYRDVGGVFDKIVSIEMIEAVGHRFLPSFFETCAARLAPEGLMLLQGITIGDHRYESYRKQADFIQRYVFPGSCLPSITALCDAAARSSDLRPAHLEDFSPHYAETLRRWRLRFEDRLSDVRAMGYSEEFIRLWRYYLCYCEAGFDEGSCGAVQMLFARRRRRRQTLDVAGEGGAL